MSSDKKRQTDSDLFRQTVGKVEPVNHEPRHTPESKPIPRILKKRDYECDQILELSDQFTDFSIFPDQNPDELDSTASRMFIRPGVQNRTMKQLRRGKIPLQNSLDLHGLTAVQARQKLNAFIANSIASKHRAVMVIHGKGTRSSHGKPVLKNRVNVWLREHDSVLGFCSAAAHHGGSGALYVLLKMGNS
ncbi:MAG: Smr/MutS family protein [Gammaproteobacteria bacterium]|nr:Smr/MutS family protein [Gammaproteobacteria bacterium]